MGQSLRRGLGGRGEVELRHRQQLQVDQSATRGTWGCVAATHEVAACRVAAPLSGFGTTARCDGARLTRQQPLAELDPFIARSGERHSSHIGSCGWWACEGRVKNK